MTRRSLSGGDALTWALLLGVGGFAVFKVVEDVREQRAATAPATGNPTTGTPSSSAPAAPVVTTPGGAVVAPTAPVVVGGGAVAAPGTVTAAVLPVQVIESGALYVRVRAVMDARLRIVAPGRWSAPEGFPLAAGQEQTYALTSGAVLQVMTAPGAWVSVASSSSPNNALPVVAGPGGALVHPVPRDPIEQPGVPVPPLLSWPDWIKGSGGLWPVRPPPISTQPVGPVDL